MSVYYRNLTCVSIADSCTFHLNLMCRKSLERKIYNNDDITFFSVYKRVPSPRVITVFQPSQLCGSGCNTLSHSGLKRIQKRMFYPLIKRHFLSRAVIVPLFGGVEPFVQFW